MGGSVNTEGSTAKSAFYFSSKLDAKDVPKLPKGQTTLRGQVSDDWLVAFKVKMDHAGVGDILKADFKPPGTADEGYDIFVKKDNFVRSHLINATLGTNAYNFMDSRKQNGLEMWEEFLTTFQGEEHEEDDAVSAAALMEAMV